MELFDILSEISAINRDNGKKFTQTDRLDAITSSLWDSNYRRINSDGLFNLYLNPQNSPQKTSTQPEVSS